MHLVQILLPLADNEGRPFPGADYARLRQELSDRFGGITSYSRAPAEGLWKDGGETSRDDVVIFEVMAETLDRAWWQGCRVGLEARFRQDAIVMRALPIERL
jgi:hypothetical protein